jgi:hypothetical protein
MLSCSPAPQAMGKNIACYLKVPPAICTITPHRRDPSHCKENLIREFAPGLFHSSTLLNTTDSKPMRKEKIYNNKSPLYLLAF